MESNNWRPPLQDDAQQQPPSSIDDGGDWRSQIPPDSGDRIVNKIVEELKNHLPFPCEGLHELQQIATRFEQKIYSEARSQSDYLRKMSLKMLTLESRSQNTLHNAVNSNSAGVSRNPQDSGQNGKYERNIDYWPRVTYFPLISENMECQSS